MNLKTEEFNRLESTKSRKEWNGAREDIKRARNGKFPDDWMERVLLGGLLQRVEQNWT